MALAKFHHPSPLGCCAEGAVQNNRTPAVQHAECAAPDRRVGGFRGGLRRGAAEASWVHAWVSVSVMHLLAHSIRCAAGTLEQFSRRLCFVALTAGRQAADDHPTRWPFAAASC